MAKKKVYGLTEQTMARVKELIQVNPTGPVNGVDTSSGRQVAWVTITGAQIASGTLVGLWPCAVEIMNTGGKFVEFGYAACYPMATSLRQVVTGGAGGEVSFPYSPQIGRRYLAVREKSIDGMGVFRIINEEFFHSAENPTFGQAHQAWRRDGFSGGFTFSQSTTALPWSGGYGSSLYGYDVPTSSMMLPCAGWYEVEFSLNMTASRGTGDTLPVGGSCCLYRVYHATGQRGRILFPFSHGTWPVCYNYVPPAAGGVSYRGLFYFPDDELGLRVFVAGSNYQSQNITMMVIGSLRAQWAGPKLYLGEPPSGGSGQIAGEAIADGEPVSGTDYEYTLDGSDSYAPPGETITDYDWSVACPDASTVTGSGSTFAYDYTAKGAGSYTATLTVTFSDASTDTDTHAFTLPNPSPPANGTLTVNLFSDLNGDGDKDLGEGNVAGRYILVELVGTPGENGYLDITDADGNASGSLPPGDYLVSVWPASLYEGEYVTTTPIPYPATVTSSNTTNVAIGISTVGDLPLPGAPTYTMGAEASTFTVTGSASGLTPGEA